MAFDRGDKDLAPLRLEPGLGCARMKICNCGRVAEKADKSLHIVRTIIFPAD